MFFSIFIPPSQMSYTHYNDKIILKDLKTNKTYELVMIHKGDRLLLDFQGTLFDLKKIK